jgi:predicted TIM-barrel fold metal-dependent hydrolase
VAVKQADDVGASAIFWLVCLKFIKNHGETYFQLNSAIEGSCLIIDSHVHIGGAPAEAEPDNFVKFMDKNKIDKAVVFRYFYNEPTSVGNKFIQAAVEKHPKRYIGFAWVNPNEKTAAKEVRTAVTEWRLKGLKLHLEMNPASIAQLREVFKEAENLSIPICVHLGEDFECINVLSREFNVPIIIAHLGTGVYRLEIERLKKAITLAKHDNVYLETSGNTYPFVDYAARAVDASKIILGSDFPHEHPVVSVKIVQLLELSAHDKELILGLNIKKILKI